MSLRPRSSARFSLTTPTGAASVPDISEFNSLTSRVAALEQAERDASQRLLRVEERLERELAELQQAVETKIEVADASLAKKLASHHEVVDGKLLALENDVATISSQIQTIFEKLNAQSQHDRSPVEAQGFQQNDSPFPRATMGRPRPQRRPY